MLSLVYSSTFSWLQWHTIYYVHCLCWAINGNGHCTIIITSFTVLNNSLWLCFCLAFFFTFLFCNAHALFVYHCFFETGDKSFDPLKCFTSLNFYFVIQNFRWHWLTLRGDITHLLKEYSISLWQYLSIHRRKRRRNKRYHVSMMHM